MTILFDSQMYPDELVHHYEAISKGRLDYAAHNLSKAIYTGLLENGQNVRLINVPNVGSFPILYKRPTVKGALIVNGESISFLNIPVVKRKSICDALYNKAKTEIEHIPEDDTVVFLMYNAKSLSVVARLKRLRPSLKACMVVTDLPEYMVTPNSLPYKMASAFNFHKANYSKKSYSCVDGFVLLAPRMAERLPVDGRPWIQMEGVYESTTQVKETQLSQYKSILYTGNLSRRYGIIDLLDAFSQIEDRNYRLWIRGSGDCESEITERMKSDDRIRLFPPLSRRELIQLQKEATVLVNPVSPTQQFTNYFFPSKTLEYLASGTPVIMYHLSCLPKEYDEYIFYIEENTVESIRKKIIEVCNKPQKELSDFGTRASSFIQREKTPRVQIKKVIDFINTL